MREGKVTMVENEVEQGTGLVTIRALLENGDQRLWPGTVLDARLVLRDDPNALVVPGNAVQISQTGSFVFVVEDNKAKVVPVTVARSTGEFMVLAEGPPPGTTVVTDGQIRLVDGSPVEVQKSEQGLEARR
jgi:multidrug efflux system membrane fusion protein